MYNGDGKKVGQGAKAGWFDGFRIHSEVATAFREGEDEREMRDGEKQRRVGRESNCGIEWH